MITKVISRIILKMTEFSSAFQKLNLRNIMQQMNRLTVETNAPPIKICLLPHFLIIWIETTAPTIDNKLIMAGNIFYKLGNVLSVISPEYCTTATPPRKCCWQMTKNPVNTAKELLVILLEVVFIYSILYLPLMAPSASMMSISTSASVASLGFSREYICASIVSFKIQLVYYGLQMNDMAYSAPALSPLVMYHFGVSKRQKYVKLMI